MSFLVNACYRSFRGNSTSAYHKGIWVHNSSTLRSATILEHCYIMWLAICCCMLTALPLLAVDCRYHIGTFKVKVVVTSGPFVLCNL